MMPSYRATHNAKILLGSAVIIVCIFATTACGLNTSGDWSPYTSFRQDISQRASVDSISSLSELLEDAYEIAYEFDSNVTLAAITFRVCYSETLVGRMEFLFTAPHEYRNEITRVDLFFDTNLMTFYEVRFLMGHGRRVGGSTTPMSLKYVDMKVEELYKIVESLIEKNLSEIDSHVTVFLSHDILRVVGSGIQHSTH